MGFIRKYHLISIVIIISLAIVPSLQRASAVAQPSTNGKYFEVIPENLGVYDNRGGTLQLVGYLKGGQTFPAVSESENWYGVSFNGYTGYVLKQSTTRSSSSAIKNEYTSMEKTIIGEMKLKEETEVYDNSSGSLVSFSTLPAGSQYSIIGHSGDWYKVELARRVGYIHKSRVELLFSNTYQVF